MQLPVMSLRGKDSQHVLASNAEEADVIVGIDFGTTFSGLSYAFRSEPEEVYAVDTWPCSRKTAVKVPTIIRYTDEETFKWGSQLDRTTPDRIEAIKLLLEPNHPAPLYISLEDLGNAEAVLSTLDKSAVEVVADYMGALCRHALKVICARYPEGFVDTLSKQFVLSVPAVWSDKAKDSTLQAARAVGISNVKLVKEPEAAALYTLDFMGNKGLSIGDAIVICDAGGGTVDLISYEIEGLNPLRLKEVVPASGAMAGSLMINRRFEEWVRSVISPDDFPILSKTRAYRNAIEDFEVSIKPGFRSRQDQDCFVTFPGAKLKDNLPKGLERDTITLTGNKLHELFEPVVEEVLKLVNQQVKDVRYARMRSMHPNAHEIKAIFLVGGFGSSVYLHEMMEKAHRDIQVIQPNGAQEAILKGSVLSQLPNKARVTTSVAPKHYGVSLSSRYEASRDAGQGLFWNPYEEFWQCSTMCWYIAKGEDVKRSRQIEFSFYRTFDPYPSSAALQIEDSLRECSEDQAPIHPEYDIVFTNVTLSSDLSGIPEYAFRKRRRINRSGQQIDWWELDYSLLVRIGAQLEFSLRVNGVEYAAVNAKY